MEIFCWVIVGILGSCLVLAVGLLLRELNRDAS
jgi:hypothetical protein